MVGSLENFNATWNPLSLWHFKLMDLVFKNSFKPMNQINVLGFFDLQKKKKTATAAAILNSLQNGWGEVPLRVILALQLLQSVYKLEW